MGDRGFPLHARMPPSPTQHTAVLTPTLFVAMPPTPTAAVPIDGVEVVPVPGRPPHQLLGDQEAARFLRAVQTAGERQGRKAGGNKGPRPPSPKGEAARGRQGGGLGGGRGQGGGQSGAGLKAVNCIAAQTRLKVSACAEHAMRGCSPMHPLPLSPCCAGDSNGSGRW